MNQRKADADKTDAVKIVQAVLLCQCALTRTHKRLFALTKRLTLETSA